MEACEMQTTNVLLGLLRERGKRGLPLQRLYRQLYNTNLYLTAYGRIYRNVGSMTPGVTEKKATRTACLERQAPGGSNENDPGCVLRWNIQRPLPRLPCRTGMPHGPAR